MWDDLAHGKGVYVAEQGLVRFISVSLSLSLLTTCSFTSICIIQIHCDVIINSQLVLLLNAGMRVNGFEITWKDMGLLKLIYLIYNQCQVLSMFIEPVSLSIVQHCCIRS